MSNTFITMTAALINHHNQKKTVKRIYEKNEANKEIIYMGKMVHSSQILPETEMLENLCITGGTVESRNKLLFQNIRQCLANNIPLVILHEHNCDLELGMKNLGGYKEINVSKPFYEPLYQLTDPSEVAKIVLEAAREFGNVEEEVSLYIKALVCLAEKKGFGPYIRLLASFPNEHAQEVILDLQKEGKLTTPMADAIRNNLKIEKSEWAKLESYFDTLVREENIIASKRELSHSTSISECIKRNRGILMIDLESFAKRAQLGLVRAEIQECIKQGSQFRLIIDGESIAKSKMLELLGEKSPSFCWTVSTSNVATFIGQTEEVDSWVTLCEKVIVFESPLSTAESLSLMFGDYEHTEVSRVQGGAMDCGKFGLHFGANKGLQTTKTRERKVSSKEITHLKENEFYMLTSKPSEIRKGVLI